MVFKIETLKYKRCFVYLAFLSTTMSNYKKGIKKENKEIFEENFDYLLYQKIKLKELENEDEESSTIKKEDLEKLVN